MAKYLLLILVALTCYGQQYTDSYLITFVTKADSDSLWQDLNAELGIDIESYEMEFDGYYIRIWRTEDEGVQYNTSNLTKGILIKLKKRKLAQI